MLWIRTLLTELAAGGRTVFLSSHLMSEMALTVRGQLEVTGLTSDEIGYRASAHGLTLLELTPVQASLEEAFMALTHDAVEFHAG